MIRADQACTRAQQIRALNDSLRTRRVGGRILLTSGVVEKGAGFQLASLNAIRTFSDFHEANDPHAEHDFGSVDVEGFKVFFKIDYYSLDLQGHSPDPGWPDPMR